MKIEIVSHCYAAQLPHYAGLLWYQVGGLYHHPPQNCSVGLMICYDWEDTVTRQVVEAARKYILVGSLCFDDVSQLFRRSIGRNEIARLTNADIVWFCDCDYVIHGPALDWLARYRWTNESMIFPKTIQILESHDAGDHLAKRVKNVDNSPPPDLDVNDQRLQFADKHYNRAIGGVQIVRGDMARAYGYCRDVAWCQAPRTDGKPFADFKDDLEYRRQCSRLGPIVGVDDMPGVYRLRHSQTTHAG